MNQNANSSLRDQSAIRAHTGQIARPKLNGTVRCKPIQPGYYLIRLRLQYTHKGSRPLARIL